MHELLTHAYNYVQYVLEYFANIPDSTYQLAGVFLGSTGIITVVTEIIKRRHLRKQAEKLGKVAIAWLVTAQSVALTAGAFLLGFLQLNPGILGSYTVELIGVAYMLYNFGGNVAFKKFTASLSDWVNKGHQYKEETKPTQPQETAPLTPPVLPVVPIHDESASPFDTE